MSKMAADKETTIAKVTRGLAFLCFLIAALLLFYTQQEKQITNQEDDHVETIFITSHDWPGFRFCLIVYFVGCAYNFLALLIPAGSPVWKHIPVVDLIMLMVLSACLGVGWEIEALTSNGYSGGGWERMCGPHTMFKDFCTRELLSIGWATAGVGCNFLLLAYTVLVILG